MTNKRKAVTTGYKGLAALGIILILQLLLQHMYAQAQDYNIYFGDLHSHTGVSDGRGTQRQAYEQAYNSGLADFFAITDHNFGGQTDEIYRAMPDLAAEFTDENFVSIPGWESSYSCGHANMYNADLFLAAFTPEWEEMQQSCDILRDMLIQDPDAMLCFNHPRAGNWNSFEYLSELDAMATMFEVLNGGTEREELWQDVLDKGWHLGAVGVSDTHDTDWITGYDWRTGLFARELTLDAIHDALKNMRFYATADRNLELQFTINGLIMGSLLPEPADLDI